MIIAILSSLIITTCPFNGNNRSRPHYHQYYESFVRTGSTMSIEEKQFLSDRFSITKTAIESLIEEKLEDHEVPSIAITLSGGGYRAMIASLGFMTALQDIQLLNCCSWLASVSGSSWMVSSWLAHNISLSMLKDFLQFQTTRPIKSNDFHTKEVAQFLMNKWLRGQHISLTDVWGHIISSILFEGNAKDFLSMRLSDLAKSVTAQQYPYPIFAAIVANEYPYTWCEFSPHEVGSPYLNAWVKTYDFGKKFDAGITHDTNPEISLSCLNGVFGSAFALSFRDVFLAIIHAFAHLFNEECDYNARTLRSNDGIALCSNLFDTKGLLDIRLSPAKVAGFTRNMGTCTCDNLKYYKLCDAGIDFNLPFPTIMWRKPDIIIVCDASVYCVNQYGSQGLTASAQWAKKNGYKFPDIKRTIVRKRGISVFHESNDSRIPTIIYVPNNIPFPTLKFRYTNAEFLAAFNDMKDIIMTNESLLKFVIKKVVEKKRMIRITQQPFKNKKCEMK